MPKFSIYSVMPCGVALFLYTNFDRSEVVKLRIV